MHPVLRCVHSGFTNVISTLNLSRPSVPRPASPDPGPPGALLARLARAAGARLAAACVPAPGVSWPSCPARPWAPCAHCALPSVLACGLAMGRESPAMRANHKGLFVRMRERLLPDLPACAAAFYMHLQTRLPAFARRKTGHFFAHAYDDCSFGAATSTAVAGPRPNGLEVTVTASEHFFASSKICASNGHKVHACIDASLCDQSCRSRPSLPPSQPQPATSSTVREPPSPVVGSPASPSPPPPPLSSASTEAAGGRPDVGDVLSAVAGSVSAACCSCCVHAFC